MKSFGKVARGWKNGFLRQIKQWIPGFALDADLKIKIGFPRLIGFPGMTNRLAFAHVLVRPDGSFAEMGVNRCEVVGMPDNHGFAEIF